MTDKRVEPSEAIREKVYNAAVKLLGERRNEEGFSAVTEWVTSTEIAAVTRINKDAVREALTSLNGDRLQVRTTGEGGDVEVLGAAHADDSDE